MAQFKPRDLIALVAFGVCALLLTLGLDGEVKALMGVIIGYYFHGVNNTLTAKKNHASGK